MCLNRCARSSSTGRCPTKSNFIDVRDLRAKENITPKDVRFHHRICDAQKHLVQGAGNFVNLSMNKENLSE